MAFVVVKDIKEEPAYADVFLKLMAEVLHVQPTDDHSDEDDHLVKEEEESYFGGTDMDYGGDFDPDMQDGKEPNQDEKKFRFDLWNGFDVDNDNHSNIHLSQIGQVIITDPSDESMEGADISEASPENGSNDQINKEYGNSDDTVDSGYDDDSQDSAKENNEEAWQLGDNEELLSAVHTTIGNIPLSDDLRHDGNDVAEYNQPVLTEVLNDCDAEVTDLEGDAVYEKEFLVKSQSCKKFKWLKGSAIYNSAMVSVVLKDIKEEPSYADAFRKLMPESLHVEPSEDITDIDDHLVTEEEVDFFDEGTENGIDYFVPGVQDVDECTLNSRKTGLNWWSDGDVDAENDTNHDDLQVIEQGFKMDLICESVQHGDSPDDLEYDDGDCDYDDDDDDDYDDDSEESVEEFGKDPCQLNYKEDTSSVDCDVRLNNEDNCSFHEPIHIADEFEDDQMNIKAVFRSEKEELSLEKEEFSSESDSEINDFAVDRTKDELALEDNSDDQTLGNENLENYVDENYQCDSDSSFKDDSRDKHKKVGFMSDMEDDYQDEEGHNGSLCCEICQKNFSLKSSLKRHIKYVHCTKGKMFHCEICGNKFKYLCSLKKHQHTHSKVRVKSFTCSICSKKFYTMSHLNRHIRHVHENIRPFKCDTCDKRFTTSPQLREHVLTHTVRERTFPCDKCDKKFATAVAVKYHQRAHTDDRPFQCDKCDSSFKCTSSLHTHQRSHSSERPFSCEMCPSAFKTRSYLKTHCETAHSDVKEHTCVICSKSFKAAAILRSHMIIHSNNMPYECDLCGKKFKRKTSLRWHKLTHSGDKKYVCDICDVAFTYPGNLHVHKMIHEDRYLHTCSFCKKKCRTSSQLKKHKMTHTGEKPLHCQVCGKGFIHSVNLKAHLLTHSGEQPHVCNICKRRFSHMSNMKRHRRQVHA